MLVPGALALVFGWFAFRSRIRGVYFSIVTQALTYAATLLFFQNATGFGGNNGLTDFKRILGWPLHHPSTRALLYVACVFPLIRMLCATRWEKATAVALFLSAWTTILLLPNPLMPASVARSHFWETLVFSLTFGALLGWLLSETRPPRETAATAP